MVKNDRAHAGQYNIILIGLLVGLCFYVIDVIIDAYVFGGGTLREEFLSPSNHEIWMRTAVVLVAVAFSIYVRVLLKREREIGKRAKTAESFLNSVVDNIPGMIFIKDAASLRFVRINHTGEELLGLTTKELIGRNDYDFFPESQADFFTRKDREVLESGIDIDIPEEQIDTQNQGKRWLHTRKVPILDESGQPVYLLGISEDITEVKRAATALKKTEVRFQTLFNSAADFIFVIDPEGEIIETNRHASECSGYDKREMVGENIKAFFTSGSQDTCDCNFPGLRERGYNRADIEFVCKDGRILQMECMATGVPDENGSFTTFLIIQRDVTDKKQAEKEIQRQRRDLAHVMRLSTMGEMASGMAHELNQPLAALTSYCGAAATLVESLPTPLPELDKLLEQAMEQAHRASQIIRHLREFLIKDDGEKEPVDIDQVIEGVIDFIRPDLRNGHVKIEHHPDAQGHRVMANKVQIEQVLVNLLTNSLEAIKDLNNTAWKIDIQTHRLPDGSIETTVTDNGPGLDADMAGRLFSPFQTSKPSGMGMGLSISRSILESHEGKLWVDEQYQNGARFGFNLPASD